MTVQLQGASTRQLLGQRDEVVADGVVVCLEALWVGTMRPLAECMYERARLALVEGDLGTWRTRAKKGQKEWDILHAELCLSVAPGCRKQFLQPGENAHDSMPLYVRYAGFNFTIQRLN